ncbi:glycosyltransferase [Candidatus Peregrinibacteria bacterium]|nr:glycosyltransferase [Candidatus Peregrinibacteria bacterium]
MPALHATSLSIKICDSWVPQGEFAALLTRAKIFLYMTAAHKAGFFRRLPAEGFGLPALEAAACGAVVASNLLGGVTDFLTPGENCIKLPTGSLAHDATEIQLAVKNYNTDEVSARAIQNAYGPEAAAKKWVSFFHSLDYNTERLWSFDS